MRQAVTRMYSAASRFALKAEEGDVLATCNALSDITSACRVIRLVASDDSRLTDNGFRGRRYCRIAAPEHGR